MRFLTMRPWARGPLLLLRRPGVALAVAAAAFVATLPAAAAAPFLSASRSATLHRQIERTCQWDLGVRVSSRVNFQGRQTDRYLGPGSSPPEPELIDGRTVLGHRTRISGAAAERVDSLGPPVETITNVFIARTATRPDIPAAARLMYRTGALDHVEVRAGRDGPGVWLPDEYAEANRLRTGDTITLYSNDRIRGELQAPAQLRVVGIFTDLRRTPPTPYWCTSDAMFRGPPGTGFDEPPPVLMLVDRETMLSLGDQMYFTADHTIEHSVEGVEAVTQPQTDRVAAQIEGMRDELFAAEPAVFRPDYLQYTRFGSLLGHQSDRADFVRRNLVPPVIPITAAGVLVGLLVVGASAIFWTQRRERELRALAAHGVGAGALGAKAVLESAPALVAGAVAGWAAAWGLVRSVGPSSLLSAEALPLSLWSAGATLALAVVVVGVAAGVRSRALTDEPATRAVAGARGASPGRLPARGARSRGLGRIPWEVLLIVGAYPVWRWLDDSTQAVSTTSEGGLGAVARVPGRLLVVPIMVATGMSVLAIRLGATVLRRSGRGRASRTPGALLAWRRLGRGAATAATLAGAVAIPISLATYGGVVHYSVRATLAAEARAIVGADVVLTLTERAPIPPSLTGRATEVLRLDGTTVDGIRADVIGVDPATFTRGAFWDDRMSRVGMDDMLDRLRPGGDAADAVRAFGSGVAPGGRHDVAFQNAPIFSARIDNADRLPAERGGYPVVMVHLDVLEPVVAKVSPQLWVRGEPAEVIRLAQEANLPLAWMTAADGIYRDSVFEPVTYTFTYLSALSILTGLITTVGLLMYLEGRAPAHRRSYVILRRMGLRRRTHLRALLTELAVPLAAGLFGGLAIATVLTLRLAGRFDLNPTIAPGTVLTVPTPTVLGVTAAVTVIALLSAGYAHRRVVGARPGEVLRDTT